MPTQTSASLRTRLQAGLPFLILVLLLIFFFYDVVFFGKTFSTSALLPGTTPNGPSGFSGHRPDLAFSFDTAGNAWVNEPNPYIIRNVLNEGSLTTWNSREGLGMPLIANMNNEVFNPLKLFLNLFPGPFAQDMFFLLRLFVMGLFTYLFLRERGHSPAPSLFGSSFFMLSGYSVWWINLHPLSTVMYLPAVFYFYERWSNRRELKSAFLMSLFLSFAIVSGKIPDVIIGFCLLFFYAIWKGVVAPPPTPPLKLRGGGGSYGRGEREVRSLSPGWRVLAREGILGSMFREGGKLTFVGISGALMASVALLPFLELYSRASPLAKAIRTGSACHTIPLITSVSLFQPLFLGWKNYLYGSWLKGMPGLILPHAGLMIAILFLYAALHGAILKKTFPFSIFSMFLFLTVYGLDPFHAASQMPVFRSIAFLKYNAMFYFSLAVISAHAFDHLLAEGKSRKKFYISLTIVSMIILACFLALYGESPPEMKMYATAVLLLSISGMIILGLSFRFTKKIFGILFFAFLVLELFLYMPKDHPDRTNPYKKPPYLDVLKEEAPFRFIGDGGSIPPLVSNAIGLYDIRSINVLLPGNYYTFFQNLLSFSASQTNNPDPLFAATSPFIDLVGVKYIASLKSLEFNRLENEIRSHVASMRWIRLFEAMINHTIKGGVTYGFFGSGGEERFSFVFPAKFVLRTRLRVSEPFLFVGVALKDAPEGATVGIKVAVENEMNEFSVKDGRWNDKWIDVSRYMGKVITVVMEGDDGKGSFALGDFGLSPGPERERVIYDNLLALHKKEFDFLKYIGAYENIHIYENRNVMDRAFILHKVKPVSGLNDVIRELQEGSNFREIGLVENYHLPLYPFAGEDKGGFSGEKVIIKKYAPDKVAIDVESKGGLLVLSDLYYPGWKVRVNGRDGQIIKVFGLLRGAEVGEGKSEVLFYYQPISFYAGCVISLMSFLVWGGVFVISRRKIALR